MQSFSQRTLLTIAFVLSLVTIGGNCRGSLAQSPQERECGSPGCEVTRLCSPSTPCVESGDITPLKPTEGITVAEWQKAFDACRAIDGLPVVLARRNPGISAGVGCARQHEGW
jgi:hypothetical protein